MDLPAAKKIALQAMMDCLGYAAQEGTPMFSARLGADGPGLLFVGSTSGNTLGQFLEAAVATSAAGGSLGTSYLSAGTRRWRC